MTEPLVHEFPVACSVEHAFDVWAVRTGMWWPAAHSVSGSPEAVVFEPRAGGRIFERAPGGEEHDWGRVVAWEPPRRLVYTWHLRQDRADATEVEISFTRPRSPAAWSGSSTAGGSGWVPAARSCASGTCAGGRGCCLGTWPRRRRGRRPRRGRRAA